MKLDESTTLSFGQVQELLGEWTRGDGRPLSRGTVFRCIRAGLPAHRLTDRGPYFFLRDELEAFVGNRWNRRTPDRPTPKGEDDTAAA